MMIALSQSPEFDIENRADEIRKKLEISLSDRDTYDVLVGRGNTMESIRDRVRVASEILGG